MKCDRVSSLRRAKKKEVKCDLLGRSRFGHGLTLSPPVTLTTRARESVSSSCSNDSLCDCDGSSIGVEETSRLTTSTRNRFNTGLNF